MHDIEYIDQGLFTAFLPCSKAGETVWRKLATFTDGTGKIPTIQAKQLIYQLRRLGYKVRKAPKPDSIDADSLLSDLGL